MKKWPFHSSGFHTKFTLNSLDIMTIYTCQRLKIRFSNIKLSNFSNYTSHFEDAIV